jgi:chemotaxis protein MotB
VPEVGITLKRFPERRFMVIHHADDMPLTNAPYKDNWDLSIARAMTVTNFLESRRRMSAKNLVPAGVGDTDPISKDREKNRRIEIALLLAINDLPPLPASLDTDTAIKAEAEAEPAKPVAPSASRPGSVPSWTLK